jgi:hypothetical protein
MDLLIQHEQHTRNYCLRISHTAFHGRQLKENPPPDIPNTKHTGLTDITPFLLTGHRQIHHIMLAQSTPENSQVHI